MQPEYKPKLASNNIASLEAFSYRNNDNRGDKKIFGNVENNDGLRIRDNNWYKQKGRSNSCNRFQKRAFGQERMLEYKSIAV